MAKATRQEKVALSALSAFHFSGSQDAGLGLECGGPHPLFCSGTGLDMYACILTSSPYYCTKGEAYRYGQQAGPASEVVCKLCVGGKVCED